ncbi:MAG: LCP family protein [Clostridiales bacterium]|nr:LCP family protein [Clostridiales bacterium]
MFHDKSKSKAIMFGRTFLSVFLTVTIVLVPVFAMTGKVAEILDNTPGEDGSPVLEEEVDFTELIPADSPLFDAFTNTNRINILAIGADRNNLTDTIMLVSFDVDNKFIDIISVPRDTYYYRGPGYADKAHHKINAAYRGDPVNTAKAVSEILMNIPINKYVLVSYEGVAAIVDEIGGVPMDIPFHMKYDDQWDRPPLHVDIKPGH